MENKKRVFVMVILGALVISNVFFSLQYFFVSQDLKELESTRSKVEVNDKVIDFASLFIKEVLQAEGEVNFETRLSLENAVRNLKDQQIMTEWQSFIGSKTEIQAQESVKRLLGILIDKIQK